MLSLLLVLQLALRLAWDIETASLEEAQSFTYVYYLDGAEAAVIFADVRCEGQTPPYTCSAPLPPLTPGNHTVEIAARNVVGEGPRSDPFVFMFSDAVPRAPTGLRLVSLE